VWVGIENSGFFVLRQTLNKASVCSARTTWALRVASWPVLTLLTFLWFDGCSLLPFGSAGSHAGVRTLAHFPPVCHVHIPTATALLLRQNSGRGLACGSRHDWLGSHTSFRAASRVREVGVGPWHCGFVGGLAGLALVDFLASCCIRCWHTVAFLTVLYRLV